MIRILIVVAALIVLTGLVAFGIAVGRHWERVVAHSNTRSFDWQTYHELAEFTRCVLGAQPLEDPAYIPEWLKAQGNPLLAKIGTQHSRHLT